MHTKLSIGLTTAAALVILAGCTGVGQKNYEGGAYQQFFFGGKLVRQADFPTPAMCGAGMRRVTALPPDTAMTCAKDSRQIELPYTGRVENASWGLDATIHYRAREACLREANDVPKDVKITCP